MPRLEDIRRALSAHEAREIEPERRRQAAVAMVLRGDPRAPEVLFIERARHEADPWSGHMAFPGGRVDPEDPHPRGAAERETWEEVGVDLGAAERLGQLDDMQGHHAAGHPGLVISGFVYHLQEAPPLVPNREVEQAFWFPLGQLHDPQRHVEYDRILWKGSRFPGLLVGQPQRHVVWGLTYRFLEHFFEIVGRPLPDRWSRRAEPRG